MPNVEDQKSKGPGRIPNDAHSQHDRTDSTHHSARSRTSSSRASSSPPSSSSGGTIPTQMHSSGPSSATAPNLRMRFAFTIREPSVSQFVIGIGKAYT